MYTDSERGRWAQGMVLAGTGMSVFCWKGGVLKRFLFGFAGMTIGFLVKNNLR